MSNREEFCWETIGVRGDRSCHKLEEVIHCRFCDTFRRNSTAQLSSESLEDYLISMYERMSEESSSDGKGTALVVVMLEKKLFGIMVDNIDRIIKNQRIYRVPGRSNNRFLGLVNIAGSLQPCFSLHAILDICSENDTPVFINLIHNEQTWIYPVNEVVGIYRFEDDSFVPDADRKLFYGATTHNQQPLVRLDIAELVRASEESLL